MNIMNLHKDEKGSAMTEFVITLPVFIIIFSGIGSLYSLNQDILEKKATVNADLWQSAEMGAGKLVPFLAVTQAAGSWGDLVQNGGSALGIYADSGLKASLPVTLLPGTKPSSVCFTVGCALGGATPDAFSYDLLNDNSADAIFKSSTTFNGKGWANKISSVLTILGSRPSFAAGIRYGEVAAEGGTKSKTTNWGTFSYELGKLDLPAITQPTHRSLAVGLTRLEFGTSDVWNKQIPEFDSDFDFEQASTGGDACSQSLQNFSNCADAGPPNESDSQVKDRCGSPDDSCEGIGGNNPLGGLGGGFCTPGTPGC